MPHWRPFFPLALIALTLAGCAGVRDALPRVYRIDIQQGNVLTADAVGQLQPGMNRRQVGYLLGTPLLMDAFHNDRWDYVYDLRPGEGLRELRHLTLYFARDALVGIQGDLRPPEHPVTPEPRDEIVVVPQRDLDDTLFGRFRRWMARRRTP